MTVREAIDRGDSAALEGLLSVDPRLADEPIDGKHPIHYLCDKVFEGAVASGGEMARVLIAAGADLDYASGDPLNAAVSLGALDVAFLLIDAGADVTLRGPFAGETALHWAALIGADALVARLIEAGAPLDVEDTRWHATPLGWAEHGLREEKLPANQHRHHETIALLRAADRRRPAG